MFMCYLIWIPPTLHMQTMLFTISVIIDHIKFVCTFTSGVVAYTIFLIHLAAKINNNFCHSLAATNPY